MWLVAGAVLGVVSDEAGGDLAGRGVHGGAPLGGEVGLDATHANDAVEKIGGLGLVVDVHVLGVKAGFVGALPHGGLGAKDVDPRGTGVLDDDGLAGVGNVVLVGLAVDASKVVGANGDKVLADEASPVLQVSVASAGATNGEEGAGLVGADVLDGRKADRSGKLPVEVGKVLDSVADGASDNVGRINVVGGSGGGAKLPGGGSLDRFGNAVAHLNLRGSKILEDNGENGLFGVVAGSILRIPLDEVSTTGLHVNASFGDVLLGLGHSTADTVSDHENTTSDRDRLVDVVERAGERDHALADFLVGSVLGLGKSLVGDALSVGSDVGIAFHSSRLARQDRLLLRRRVLQVVSTVDGVHELVEAG